VNHGSMENELQMAPPFGICQSEYVSIRPTKIDVFEND